MEAKRSDSPDLASSSEELSWPESLQRQHPIEPPKPSCALKFMFPYPHNVKSVRPELSTNAVVASSVGINLCIPVFRIACRHPTATRACVPVTAVNKHGESGFGKIEVRAARHGLGMFLPTGDACAFKRSFHPALRGFIASAPDFRHNRRALLFAYLVSHCDTTLR
jgi:hypothetical protein